MHVRCALPHPKQESSNIGYIIPTPVVRLFLSEVERRGEFRGISSLGVSSLALALMGHPTLKAHKAAHSCMRDGEGGYAVSPQRAARQGRHPRQVQSAVVLEQCAPSAFCWHRLLGAPVSQRPAGCSCSGCDLSVRAPPLSFTMRSNTLCVLRRAAGAVPAVGEPSGTEGAGHAPRTERSASCQRATLG